MNPPGGETVLAVVGDVHHTLARLDLVLERIAAERVDGVLLVGDLGSSDVGVHRQRSPAGDRRYLASVQEVLDRVGALGAPVLYVPGNHDLPDLDFPGNIDGRSERVGDLTVVGLGGAGPDRFGFAYEWEEWEVRGKRLPAGDVLLSHCPPRDTPLDRTQRGQHVGSVAVREKVEAWSGVMVCGHIHEAPGVVRLADCLCMNVGGLGRPFGRAQVGFVHGRDRVVYEDLLSGERRQLTREDAAR